MTPFVIAIVGGHNSGKTTIIARLLPALADRGLQVGTVKHAPHLFLLEAPASADTARHLRAGAVRTILFAGDAMVLHVPITAELSIEQVIARHFADCDIVLAEGFKHGAFPKIEVYRRIGEDAAEPLAGQINVACIVTDDRVAVDDDVAQFSPRDTEGIADFIADLACRPRDRA